MKWQYKTDKDPLSYKAGEEMQFIFTLDLGQELEQIPDFYIKWSRSGDDGKFLNGMMPVVPGKPAVIRTSIDRPGFVRIIATLTTADGRTFNKIDSTGNAFIRFNFDGGAGADVDKILPAGEKPADFDAFWKEQRKRLDKVPLQVKKVRLPDSVLPELYRGKIEVYNVSVDCAGPRPVTGRLFVPSGLKPKSVPVSVGFHGYGTGDHSKVEISDSLSKLDHIHFDVNAHGYDLNKDSAYYAEMNRKLDGYGFNMKENESQETCYFNGMALRVMRAFDFVKTLPQWNGKDLIAQGGSQGGLQTIWAASLVPGISEAKPSVTWCCDIDGTSIGRQGGWRPEFSRGLAYYDAVFHAGRIPASCYLNVQRLGLGDYVCPPSGTAAQFNAANCRKRVRWMQDCSHLYLPSIDTRQTFVIEKPAGCGIRGTAPRREVQKLDPVKFVPTRISSECWTLTREDGTTVGDFAFQEKQINFRKGRAADGKDLPVLGKVTLSGEIVAEKDGFILLGAGFDWWWNCKVNGKEVFGRTRSSGCNVTAAFDKTDWIFRAPVRRGVNTVTVDIVLGEHGTGNIDILSPEKFADREIGKDALEHYRFMQKNYPEPDPMTPITLKGGTLFAWMFGGNTFQFRSAQPYPAGIEYREKGAQKWNAVWDSSMSLKHEIKLDLASGKTYELRTVQNVFLEVWNVIRTNPVERSF